MEAQFKYLFTPFKIGPITVKNRIFSSSHLTQLADQNHLLDDRYIEYQRNKAKGGLGMTICGMMNVMPNSREFLFIQEIYDEKVVPRLKLLAEAVHEQDCKVLAQLVHCGRETDIEISRQASWAPSALAPSVVFHDTPKAMEIEDIKTVVKAFGISAGFAKKAGLDGVELHGGSGYLIEQFMSPYSNKRNDEYGGDMDKRLRFLLEVIDSILESAGSDFVLGLRMPGDELVPGGYNIDEMKQIAQKLEDHGGVDYLSITAPFYEAFMAIGTGMQTPLGLYAGQCAQFKEAVDLPIMTAFRINDPIQAEKLLADGAMDMVGMARALIADPELPNKAKEGRIDEIRSCIACNQGCLSRIFKQKPISCLQNPETGREKELGPMETAKTKKKVVVIGGGPGGMEAARVARLRGHDVVLYEKENELGGQVNIAVKVTSRKEFGGCIRYRIKQMEISGVKVIIGTEATPEIIEKENPDVVVVATGSTPKIPLLPGADQKNVVSVHDVLLERADIGEKVLVVDGGEGHWECCSVVEYLVDMGKKVEIVTPLMFVGQELVTTTDLTAFYMRMRPRGVVFSPNTVIKEISGNTVVVLDLFAFTERTIEDVDTVVLAMGNQANNQIYYDLKGKVKELYAIGDCLSPRKAIDAIYDGYNIGRSL